MRRNTHSDRANWHTLHFSSEKSNLVDISYTERMAKKYGEDSNIYRVRVLGEFPSAEEDQLIPLDLLESAVGNTHIEPSGEVLWGLDPARFGSDETALAIRQGNVIKDIRTIRNFSTMQVVGWVIDQYDKAEEKPTSIYVDTIGLGAGIFDRLLEQEYPVISVNVSSSSSSSKYRNKRSEIYDRFKQWLMEGDRYLPDDAELISQLSSIKYFFDSSGRLQLEKKENMKRRGLHSPDRADALVMCFLEMDYGDWSVEGVGRTLSNQAVW